MCENNFFNFWMQLCKVFVSFFVEFEVGNEGEGVEDEAQRNRRVFWMNFV